MDGANSRTPTAGGEELDHPFFVLKAGDVLEEFRCLLDREWLEMLGLEETEEGAVPIGEVFHQSLCGGDNGEAGILLDEGTQLFLPGITQSFENGVEILGHDEKRARAEGGEKVLRDEFLRGGGFEVIRGSEHLLAEFGRIPLLQCSMDFQEKLTKRRAGLILVQPSDAQAVCEGSILGESADDQRGEVGFTTAAWAHKEEVVLVICKSALSHSLHGVPQEVLPLDENELEVLWVGAARGKNPDGFTSVGTLCWV